MPIKWEQCSPDEALVAFKDQRPNNDLADAETRLVRYQAVMTALCAAELEAKREIANQLDRQNAALETLVAIFEFQTINVHTNADVKVTS